MALAIMGFISIVISLLVIFINTETTRRKEEELEKEIKEMEVRMRLIERYGSTSHFIFGGGDGRE